MVEKRFYAILATLLALSMVAVSFVSAGLFDITGKAASQPTNVTVNVVGMDPAQIVYVSPIANVDPNELGSVSVQFDVHMYDINGYADLNHTSVSADFSKSGQTTRYSGTCPLQNKVDSRTGNYSCTIDMQYWDGAGGWNITVQGADLGNKTMVYNTTTSFIYNQLKAMVISPNAITWPLISGGAVNQPSDNDPTIVNNTGNYNGTVKITAVDLVGEDETGYNLTATNFTASPDNGGSPPAECSGTSLAESVIDVAGTDSNPGDLSLGGGSGQEQIYYCIPQVPPALFSQAYSTLNSNSWAIQY